MKFCLLVSVALDIFIKEKIILLSSLDFSFAIFLCKRCLLVKLSGKVPINHFPTPPGYSNAPARLLYFTQISKPPA